jgi:hypothetical protein
MDVRDTQWIGFREKLQETTYLMGKSMVSCRLSLKPIHSDTPKGKNGTWTLHPQKGVLSHNEPELKF